MCAILYLYMGLKSIFMRNDASESRISPPPTFAPHFAVHENVNTSSADIVARSALRASYEPSTFAGTPSYLALSMARAQVFSACPA